MACERRQLVSYRINPKGSGEHVRLGLVPCDAYSLVRAFRTLCCVSDICRTRLRLSYICSTNKFRLLACNWWGAAAAPSVARSAPGHEERDTTKFRMDLAAAARQCARCRGECPSAPGLSRGANMLRQALSSSRVCLSLTFTIGRAGLQSVARTGGPRRCGSPSTMNRTAKLCQ